MDTLDLKNIIKYNDTKKSYQERFYSNINSIQNITTVNRTGKLMFTHEDIYKTDNPLTKLLRSMFVENHVTHEYFKEAHARYSKGFNLSPNDVASQCNNWKRTAYSERITYKFLVLMSIMLFSYRLVNMQITFQTPNGEIKNYSLEEINDALYEIDSCLRILQ